MKIELDAKNLLCPLPVIRVQDKIKTLAAGDTLSVMCTDPGVKYDIPVWCRLNGHKILKTEQVGRVIELEILVNSCC